MNRMSKSIVYVLTARLKRLEGFRSLEVKVEVETKEDRDSPEAFIPTAC